MLTLPIKRFSKNYPGEHLNPAHSFTRTLTKFFEVFQRCQRNLLVNWAHNKED